ncbi:hypothetical protein [Alsobacter sp. SYSU BS001988]
MSHAVAPDGLHQAIHRLRVAQVFMTTSALNEVLLVDRKRRPVVVLTTEDDDLTMAWFNASTLIVKVRKGAYSTLIREHLGGVAVEVADR